MFAVGPAILTFSLFLYVLISGQCLDPYNDCAAGAADYAVPLISTIVILLIGAYKWEK